ncbi:MAG: hypothetical protein RSB04_10315 [Gordonibacter sp.]|uniref:hypothetical protein n=1 Tax=Gordonibacter sp. TaxID=1968902 RepID=UPI002FCAB558
MNKTLSATQPERVLIESNGAGESYVWLRRNIMHDVADRGVDGSHIEFWSADEICFLALGTPSVGDIDSDFDALWSAHEEDKLTDRDIARDAAQRVSDVEQAVAELGTLFAGGK